MFAAASLPSHVCIYTFSNCTLYDLALELAALVPQALPSPAVGTRIVFQLVCPDIRSTTAINNAKRRFVVKDLGSVVIGGARAESGDLEVAADQRKTLGDARFVVGDYVSCAVLPLLPDGSVAPASNAKRGSTGEDRKDFRGGLPSLHEGFYARGRGGRGAWPDVGGRIDFPTGDWRRGERLPRNTTRRSRGWGPA